MIPFFTHTNNMFNFRVNNIGTNGTIDFGNVIHKGHQANDQTQYGQWLASDGVIASPVTNFNLNVYNDADGIDQGQVQI